MLEFAHPPLESAPAAGGTGGDDGQEPAPPVAGAPRLPPAWSNLPFQALPDGVHRPHAGGVQPPFFFTVPALEAAADAAGRPPAPLHATACYRQLSTAELLARQCESPGGRRRDDRITRNAVQKSVVVICRQPLYGLVQRRVSDAADAFALCGFSPDGHQALEELYHGLNGAEGLAAQAAAISGSAHAAAARLQRRRSERESLGAKGGDGAGGGGAALARSRSLPTTTGAAAAQQPPQWRAPPTTAPAFAQGAGTALLLRQIGGRAFLGLVKGVLLQRRMVIYGEPAGAVSAAVLGVAACLPCALELLGDGRAEGQGVADSGWAQVGLPPALGQGWLSGGAVGGFQPHTAMQALGEVLAEGDSGGRLLGCSPNVAKLLVARLQRHVGAAGAPGGGGGGGASSGGGGAEGDELRCDVLYNLSERSAALYSSAELEAALKLTKAETSFAARLQKLVEQHESELLISDEALGGVAAAALSSGGGEPEREAARAAVAARQVAAAAALEARLHTLMHSYIGGLLVAAGAEVLEAGGGGGGGGGGTGTAGSVLCVRHGKRWSGLWTKTAAYHAWALGLRQRRDESGAAFSWPEPSTAGPEEVRRASAAASSGTLAMLSPTGSAAMAAAAGGHVYGAVAGAGEMASWGVAAVAAGAGGAGKWVSWAAGR